MRVVSLRRNSLYAGLQGIYWMLYCVSSSFAAFFLEQNGFTSSEIGLVLSLGYITGMILQPIFAAIADKNEKISTSGMILAGLFGCVLSVILLTVFHGRHPLLCFAYILFIGFSLTVQPLVNAMAFYLERLETPVNFGLARGIGSFSYAVLAVILGKLTVSHSHKILPLSGILVCAVFIVLTLLLRREGVAPSAKKAEQSASALTLRVLWTRYRGFVFLLIGTLGLHIGHSLVNNYLILIIENIGGNSADLGTLCSYTALVELPPMFLFTWLLKKVKVGTMLKIAVVAWLVRIALIPYAQSVLVLFLINTLQGPSFAVFTLGSIQYVEEIMSTEDSNRGQALLTVAVTLANTVSSALGGILIDRISIQPTLLCGTAVTAIGMLCILFGMNGKKTASA